MHKDNLQATNELCSFNSNLPLISIVTVIFNGEKTIKRAIESVLNQSYKNIEYILIDGCSTDGTIEIIKEYEGRIAYWISEPDNGIYDAMNKGVKASRGEWIFFLGCDDYLIDSQSINKLSTHIAEDLMMIFGDVIYSDGYHFHSSLDTRVLISNSVHHQSCLYRSELFKNFLYDVSNKVCADYELNLISFLKKHKFYYVGETISFCQTGGISFSSRNTAIAEINSIRGKHINYILNILVSQMYNFNVNLAKFKQLIIR
jgi:putative colanic acid biosynthesis glycosyltransferase